MKHLNFLPATILIIFLISCKKEDKTVVEPEMEIKMETVLPLPQECIYGENTDEMGGFLDSLEQLLLNECEEYELIAEDEIRENLIGEWQLIGYADGWGIPFGQPCAYIKISTDELVYTFQDDSGDTTTTHAWDLEATTLWEGSRRFRLKLIPEANEGLKIRVFCKHYMFENDNVADGFIYLYQKVK